MFDKSLADVLKLAEKWGVQYKLNSENPGFFTLDSIGNKKESTIEEILVIDEVKEDCSNITIDISISKALEDSKDKIKVNTPRLGFKYFNMNEIVEVACCVS